MAGETQIHSINRYLIDRGVEVYGVQPQRTSLEERFIELIGTDGGL